MDKKQKSQWEEHEALIYDARIPNSHLQRIEHQLDDHDARISELEKFLLVSGEKRNNPENLHLRD